MRERKSPQTHQQHVGRASVANCRRTRGTTTDTLQTRPTSRDTNASRERHLKVVALSLVMQGGGFRHTPRATACSVRWPPPPKTCDGPSGQCLVALSGDKAHWGALLKERSQNMEKF